ncbi:hypothetical protein, partial [Citrobacter braakii]|uniref:hypothetical protein n=1 Tax=Citrobacter braakii TaxID=57706 RepID=UPI0019805A1D
ATNTQLTQVSSKLKSVNNGLNSVNSRKGTNSLAGGYASLSRNVNVAQTSLVRMNTTVSNIEPKLTQQAVTVANLARSWGNYAREVRRANDDLRNRPTNNPPRPPRRGSNGNGGGGGRSDSSRGGSGAGA